ncbi:MAG: hypothetical protein V3T96_04665, partial [Thermodesulfobacteriota bacterium]
MSNEKNEKVERLLAFSHTYQFLSICLCEPNKDLVIMLNDKDYLDEVGSCLAEIGNGKLPELFNNVQNELQSTTLDALLEDYLATFGSETMS